jgi:1-aminocyclopropane-1-carboxylate deaminase
MKKPDLSNIPTQTIVLRNGHGLDVRRLDRIEGLTHGNKIFKLFNNIEQMRNEEKEVMVTCGGRWSNHIAATAAAGKEYGFGTVGLIRGYKEQALTKTLEQAAKNGMELRFLSRNEYAKRNDLVQFLENLELPQSYFFVPEGGSNTHGIRGASGIYFDGDEQYNHIIIAAGTGTSAAGIALRLATHQKLLVVPVLKRAENFGEIIASLLSTVVSPDEVGRIMQQIEVLYPFHFGGYGKWTEEITDIIKWYDHKALPLDQVYTAKAMAAAESFTSSNKNHDRVLIIHTGGLQGRQSLIDS